MALSSTDMYNKQMLITFKTYFMVMQIFMEVNCNIANFPRVQWAREREDRQTTLRSDQRKIYSATGQKILYY